MMSWHMLRMLAVMAALVATPGIAAAQRWQDATASCLGTTAEWSNKVEVADVDGDGLVDILIANGGNYASPGTAEPVRVWKNLGGWDTAGTHCTEISAQAVAGFTGLSRVVKAVDLDGDGDVDILTGGAYQTQLALFLRGATTWSDASAQLPQQLTSVGDLEVGDVDGDGDVDLLISDWGGTNPQTNAGGRTRLYLNDGHATFTEATSDHMPATLVKWSWEVELVDVDGDWDLDALIACKLCTTSYLFRNDGTGHFTDDANALPHFANNYDFEPMDIDGDGDLDLATINDGGQLREHIFVNDGSGTFTDESATRLTGTANPANADDNAALWVDVDNDGDADLLIGSLGADRLALNDGFGNFTLSPGATPNDTSSTLGIAVADFNDDGRLDLVQAQGESALPDKLQLASDLVSVDTTPPVITVEQLHGSVNGVIHARVNDHHSPTHAHDYKRVWLEHDGSAAALFESGPPPPQDVDMSWYGEDLWASPLITGATSYRVCATDRRNNQGCSDWVYTLNGHDDVPHPDEAGTGTHPGGGGGCCETGQSPASAVVPVGIVLVVMRRRRRGNAGSATITIP
jgi:hypothetical protein